MDHSLAECSVIVDQGAAVSIKRKGSLFPVGVAKIVGEFYRGAVVRVHDEAGELLAVGVSNYSSSDLVQVIGMKSEDIQESTSIPPNRLFDNDRIVRRGKLDNLGAMIRRDNPEIHEEST